MAFTKTSKKTTPQNSVTSGTFKSDLSRGKSKIRLMTIATAVVIVLIVVGLVWAHNHHNKKKVAAINLSDSSLTATQLINEVGSLESKGDNSAARELINNQANSSQSESDQILIAQSDINSGQTQKGLTLEENIGAKFGITESLALNMGEQAAKLNQPVNEVKYYEQAISILESQPTIPSSQQELPILQATVKNIESKPISN